MKATDFAPHHYPFASSLCEDAQTQEALQVSPTVDLALYWDDAEEPLPGNQRDAAQPENKMPQERRSSTDNTRANQLKIFIGQCDMDELRPLPALALHRLKTLLTAKRLTGDAVAIPVQRA